MLDADLDLQNFFNKLRTDKKCPMCGGKISAVKITDKKTVVIAERRHFCSWANGTCTLQVTYKKAKAGGKKNG